MNFVLDVEDWCTLPEPPLSSLFVVPEGPGPFSSSKNTSLSDRVSLGDLYSDRCFETFPAAVLVSSLNLLMTFQIFCVCCYWISRGKSEEGFRVSVHCMCPFSCV